MTIRKCMLLAGISFLLLFGCSSSDRPADSGSGPAVLTEVHIPASPEQLDAEGDAALAEADQAVEQILVASPRTFANTVVALNDILYEVDKAWEEQQLLMDASPDPTLREAAQQAYLETDAWETELFFNAELYQAIEEGAAASASLNEEEARLLERLRRDFRENGIDLPPADRQELQATLLRINELETEFNNNVTDYDVPTVFSPGELADLPASSLTLFDRDSDGNYLMDPRIYAHFSAISTFASDEAVREKAYRAYRSVAKDVNPAILAEIVRLRAKKARLLGYATYADAVLQDRMAETADTALGFLAELSSGLESRFQEEQQNLLRLKIRETGGAAAKLNQWDIAYYERLFMNEQFDFDPDAYKRYFSLENTLEGMFSFYEQLFAIEIRPGTPAADGLWQEDVRFYRVDDAASGEPLGTFYLDLYPRAGKYNHFATGDLAGSNTLPDGTRERPVAYILGNWPAPTETAPSLLSFYEVRTLFHEFGHVMHKLLSQSRYFMLSGTKVPRDFVEVPSQLMEMALRQQSVLDLFAVDYQNPDDRLPPDFPEKMAAASRAFTGIDTQGQIAYAMFDLILHTRFGENDPVDTAAVGREALADYFLPAADDTDWTAQFTHITGGYDAGYYGYQWSLAIGYDLLTVFQQSDQGFLDPELGEKLRQEIYARGSSRDENASVRAFLGRDWNLDAYLQYLKGN